MQDKTAALLTSSKDERWATDRDFFARVHARTPFGLDAAAHAHTACVGSYLGPDHLDLDRRDALGDIPWSEWCAPVESIWLNPPYGAKLPTFMRRAASEGRRRRVVCLVPARLCARWFIRAREDAVLIEAVAGRMFFLDHDTMDFAYDKHGDKMPATSGHCLIHFGPDRVGGAAPIVHVDHELERV